MADPYGGDRPSLEEEVREKGWDTDELMDRAFVGPEDEGTTEVVFHEEWEETPEAAPDDVYLHESDEVTERLSGGEPVLSWRYRGAYIKVWNEKFGVWGAEIDLPSDVSRWLNGPGGADHAVRSQYHPGLSGDGKCGYIESVEQDYDATRGEDGPDVPPTTLTVKTATNHQPRVELRSLVDDFWESAEETEAAAADAEAAFKAASENSEGE